jgi:CMP/dCMP kinase
VSRRPATIAIDGPAASGKSTVGRAVANRLGLLYLDTGAMFRAVTFLALQHNIDLKDAQAMGILAEETILDIRPPTEQEQDSRQYTVLAEGNDITWDIRHFLVDRYVSDVAEQPLVRAALRRQQREIGLRGGIVMVGRDIGTVVLPEAPLKIYLDASVEERAHRRYQERLQRGEQADLPRLLADLKERDRRDLSRAEAPLRVAEDACIINTSGTPIEQVVTGIVVLAEERLELVGQGEDHRQQVESS